MVDDPIESTTHVGPLCTKAQSAEILFDGKPLDRAGTYMARTLVNCATSETETIKVEMFGPVMSLLSFDTEDEAIALANDSDFGLGSGVFA